MKVSFTILVLLIISVVGKGQSLQSAYNNNNIVQTATNTPIIIKSGSGAHALQIWGRSDGHGYLEFYDEVGGGPQRAIYGYDSGLNFTAPYHKFNGNVGIGIAAPINGLQIFGADNNFDKGSIRLGYSGVEDAVLSFGWNGVDQDAFKISKFPHNSVLDRTDFLTIKSTNGNLGVGVSNPKSKLHIGGGTSDVISIGTTNYGGNAGQALAGIKGGQIDGGDGGTIEFQTLSWGALPYDLTTKMIILGNSGNVGIGTATPREKLSVNGKIRAKEIKVETANWPDYVFAEEYPLPSLAETEKHIKEKGHLPGIPSAKEAEANGIDLGEMNARLLKKIEELTLHLIYKEKEIDKINNKVEQLVIQLEKISQKVK